MKPRLAWVAVLAAVAAACGSRTGLLVVEEQAPDAAVPIDAGHDARIRDAPPERDVVPDMFRPDVFHNDCPDAAATLVYLVSGMRELYSFDPAAAAFRDIGPMTCPTTESAFSMAVDRTGVAYVLLTPSMMGAPGDLYRVSTANGACAPVAQYMPDQQGFTVFGMGFATIGGGPAEKLYVLGDMSSNSTVGLATIDTTTFQLSFIGAGTMPVIGGELTGTGDGRLFSLYFTAAGSFIGQIDTGSGQVTQVAQVPGINLAASAFAFAFWGGDFYLFTAPGAAPTTVTRYRPSDGSFTAVASLSDVIVGAGVSTCAPQ